jgi:hypothetical protein
MQKPRLFFSHSTKKQPEREILTGIANGLKADYATLIDRENLVIGGDWRSTLNVWIGTCDAAVLLITPEAIASEFCEYEWSILSYRRSIQPQFTIIPVYCGAEPADIAGKPHQISEITGHFNFDNLDCAVRQVRETLGAMVLMKRPAEGQALYIAKLLQDHVRRAEVVDRIAHKIELPLGTWNPLSDIWLDFSVRIMGAGLERARPGLRDLKQYFKGHEDEFNELVTLVGCSWVDYPSARRVAEYGTRAKVECDALALNAFRLETAECYILSGSERAPAENWRIGEALKVFQSYDDLRARIRSTLHEALHQEPGTGIEALKRELTLLQQDKEPIFIALRMEGLTKEWLQRLRKDDLFAWVSFLILTGETEPVHGLLPDAAVLRPELPKGFEQMFWKVYNETRKSLGLA